MKESEKVSFNPIKKALLRDFADSSTVGLVGAELI